MRSVKDLRSIVAEASDQSAPLRSKLTKVRQIISADRALIEELQEIVSQQHGELQRRAETIGTVGQSLHHVTAQQQSDRAEIAELRGSAQAYVLEIARLQERASELHSSAARLAAEQQAARSQNAALSKQVFDLETERRTLVEASAASIRKLEVVIETCTRERTAALDECKKLQERSQDGERQLRGALDAAALKLKSSEENIRRLQDEIKSITEFKATISTLTKQLAQASARADTSAQQLARELESSRAAAKAFEAERATHAAALDAALQSAAEASERARVADAAHSAEVAALRVAAEESQVRIAELTDAVDDASHITAQRDELRQQILQIRQESYEKEQRFKMDAQRATQQATESRAAQTAAEERCAQAQFVLDQAIARRAALEQSMQALTAQSAADAAQLRAALDAARAECNQMRAQATDGAARRLEVSTALAQLVNSTEAMENSFTCLHCLKLLTAPTMCIPCGHTACADCILPAATSGQGGGGGGAARRPQCHECGAAVRVDATVKNHLLDSLSGKFIYNRQVLAQLRSIVAP